MSLRRYIEIVESIQTPPVQSFDRVWHVGSMDPGQKRRGSYEGAGLSVSRHPNAWMGIARGHVVGDVWELTRSGNRFLDFHSMPYGLIAMIRQWGVDQDYLVQTTYYRLRYYDDEWEQERWIDFETRDDAEEEADMMDIDADQIEEISDGLKATPKLDARTLGAAGDIEALVPVWVEDMTDLDGVWWQDSYDPERLSAPRGVIVPSRLASWTATKLDDYPADDEPDLSGGPETPWGQP